MARPTVSGQQASNKRELVLEAAVRLFATRGVARTSMRRIAQQVGITDATLYHYYPSKDALLEAAFRSASFQTEDLEAAFEGTAGSLRERLLAVGQAFLSVLAHDREWTRLVVGEGLRVPDEAGGRDIGKLLTELGRHRVVALAAALRRDVASGNLEKCDEELVASHFFHACMGFWIGEALIMDAVPTIERREAILEHIVDLIVSKLENSSEREGQ